MTVELLGDQASSTLCCGGGVPLPVTDSTTGELDALVLTETACRCRAARLGGEGQGKRNARAGLKGERKAESPERIFGAADRSRGDRHAGSSGTEGRGQALAGTHHHAAKTETARA